MGKNNSPESNIGKVGNTMGQTSTGSKLPFMPSAESYEGRKGGSMSSNPKSHTPKESDHMPTPFMPKKPE